MSQENQSGGAQSNSLSSLFDGVASRSTQFIGLFSGLTLSISVLYDYSYLLALGLEFGEIQTTMADHLRSAIVWGPPILAVIVLNFLQGYLVGAIESVRLKTTESIAPKILKRHPWTRNLTRHFIRILGVAMIIHTLLFDNSKSAVFLVLLCSWLLVGEGFIFDEEFRQKLPKGLGVLPIIIPAIAIFVTYYGCSKAEAQIKEILQNPPQCLVHVSMQWHPHRP